MGTDEPEKPEPPEPPKEPQPPKEPEPPEAQPPEAPEAPEQPGPQPLTPIELPDLEALGYPALTGPLGPWPDVLYLTGSPTLLIDLNNGHMEGVEAEPLGPVDLAVLRVMAQRQPRPAYRGLIHQEVFARVGPLSQVDDAVKGLIRALGSYGHHVERSGRSAWRLWPGPE